MKPANATISIPRVAGDPAPALSRGLRLITYLCRDGASSLDRLTKATGWPKASVLRLLRSLELAGVVARDPDNKQYRALMRLVAGSTNENMLRSRCATAVAWACKAAKQTVEVYLFSNHTLAMIDRAEPDGIEVSVRARIGFVRRLEQADAATIIAFAFAYPQGIPAGKHWYFDNRVETAMPKERLQTLVQQARARGAAADLGINANGVRRFAAPLIDSIGGLAGVLVIAHAGAFPPGREDERYLNIITAAARRVGAIPSTAPGAT
jgi:DNA-binding IclR family transcriptional regulator